MLGLLPFCFFCSRKREELQIKEKPWTFLEKGFAFKERLLLNRLKNSCLIGLGNPSVEFENNLSLEPILFGFFELGNNKKQNVLEEGEHKWNDKNSACVCLLRGRFVFIFLRLYCFYAYIVSLLMLFLRLCCFYALRFPKNNHNQVKLICLPASHSFS